MGTLILVTAMVGVFRYEAAQAAATTVQVTWEVATVGGKATAGSTQEGETTSAAVAVDRANVTKAEFVLEWTDDLGSPDELNLTVTSPSGLTRSATGSNGRVTVAFDGLAVVPPEMRLSGRSEQDVRDGQLPRYASQAAVGDWVIEVTVVSAGDQTAPVGGVVIQADPGNEWTVTPRLAVYEAKLA